VGGLACIAPDGKKAWVMLYNLIEEYDRAPYETAVAIKLAGLPKGEWKCRSIAIAPGGCDPYLAWKAMGNPEKLTDAQRATLLKASELPAAEPLAIEDNVVKIEMPGSSVLFLELHG
jgi:hypothetical protein